MARGSRRDAEKFKIVERRSYSWLASVHHTPFTSGGLRPVNEQATGPPSLPGSLLRRSVLPSRSPSLPVYLSVGRSICLSISRSLPVTTFFHPSLSFIRSHNRQEERKRGQESLLIYDKMVVLYGFLVEIYVTHLGGTRRQGEKKGHGQIHTHTHTHTGTHIIRDAGERDV